MWLTKADDHLLCHAMFWREPTGGFVAVSIALELSLLRRQRHVMLTEQLRQTSHLLGPKIPPDIGWQITVLLLHLDVPEFACLLLEIVNGVA